MQNSYHDFKEQLNTRTWQEKINSAIPDLTSSTQDSSTATVFATPLNPFNATPGLKQAAILQKPETKSSTAPPSLNPYFLTPPSTVETPSRALKRKRRRIQFVNYLDDDDDAHGKQKRRARHKKLLAQPYQKNLQVFQGEEDDWNFFYPFQIVIYRVSQKFVPLILCVLTFDQNFILVWNFQKVFIECMFSEFQQPAFLLRFFITFCSLCSM